ncbi:MAG: hypothetical protein FWE16_02800 [Firmicutes bacterium]|nr:hypothetical protein [Bacillota bacterium]
MSYSLARRNTLAGPKKKRAISFDMISRETDKKSGNIDDKINQLLSAHKWYLNLFETKTFEEVIQFEPLQVHGRASAINKKLLEFLKPFMDNGKDHATILETYPQIKPVYETWQDIKSKDTNVLSFSLCSSAQVDADKLKAEREVAKKRDLIGKVTQLLAQVEHNKREEEMGQ